jgi:hypothetical protein
MWRENKKAFDLTLRSAQDELIGVDFKTDLIRSNFFSIGFHAIFNHIEEE